MEIVRTGTESRDFCRREHVLDRAAVSDSPTRLIFLIRDAGVEHERKQRLDFGVGARVPILDAKLGLLAKRGVHAEAVECHMRQIPPPRARAEIDLVPGESQRFSTRFYPLVALDG